MKWWKVLLCTVMAGIFVFVSGENRAIASERTERKVTAIELPQNLNFYLDPGNENGRGQIYSDKYVVRNAGKEAINFSMDMMLSLIDDQSVIDFYPEEWDEDPADRSIYMYVKFEGNQGENLCVLTDTDDLCTQKVVLEPAGETGDTLYISFGGKLSRSEDWKSGELVINAIYSMSSYESKYQVKIDGEHIKLEYGEDGFLTGEAAELYLVPEEGYFLPAKIQVSMDDQEAEFAYDAVTGKVSLEKVTRDMIIYASGITKASLPDEEIMDMEKMLWSWDVETGIQAYEYAFWQSETVAAQGRISAEDGAVVWNWSEGLPDGDYQLSLKAIGDNIHCLNSEERSYFVTVDRELLQNSEDVEENTQEPSPSPEDAGEDKTPEPSEVPGEDDGGTTLQPPENTDVNEALPSPSGNLEEDGDEIPQTTKKAEDELQLPQNEEEDMP